MGEENADVIFSSVTTKLVTRLFRLSTGTSMISSEFTHGYTLRGDIAFAPQAAFA